MFPTQSLMVLLDFARGRVTWSVQVFDAALEVLGYFGRMWIGQQQAPMVVGQDQPTDEEIVTALETLTSASSTDQEHQVAALPPMVVSILLSWLLRQITKNI